MEFSRVKQFADLVLRKPYLVFVLLLLVMFIRICSDITCAGLGKHFLSDDAYYYIVVARNFVSTGDMTFDGISTTNGYHPLWFWILVLMYSSGGLHLSMTNQVLAVICVQWLILAGTISALMYWLYRNWTNYPSLSATVLVGLTLLSYPKHLSLFRGGMEGALVFPCLLLFLFLICYSRWNWAGVVGVLLVMSRLDTLVYIIFPAVLFVALRGKPPVRSAAKRCLQVGGPAVLATVILLAAYQVAFGYPMPIHGVCKSSFPIPHVQWHHLTWPLVRALVSNDAVNLLMINNFTAVILLPICGFALRRSGFLPRSQRRAATWFVILGLIQLTNFLLFQKWGKPIPYWYLGALVVFCSGAIAAGMTNLIGTRKVVGVCLVIASVVLVLSGLREYSKYRRALSTFKLTASGGTGSSLESFVNAQPKGTIWAATDCGRISFRTGVRFVNLDGLINGFEYQAALRERRLKDYLKEASVRYLLVSIWEHEQRGYFEPMYAYGVNAAVFNGDYETFDFYVYSYMYGNYSDKLTLHRQQEVWRSSKPGKAPDFTSRSKAVVFDLR